MSDNVTLNAGTGGVTLATDDVGGIHYQLIKLSYGALDSATIVSTSNPLPVVQTGTLTVQPGNVANTTAWKVDGSAVTQPVSGTVSITANSAVNVAQLAGTTADTNSGTKSAGTLRVVLATDQPALTNKLLVTPDSVALPANQSVNCSQINGTTVLMGNGVTGTGSQRVTIASDNTAFSVNAVQSGTWNVRNQDGTGNAITSATRGSERALTVQIVDASGAQVTSFSGSGTSSVVSTANSTTANLAGAAVFTGTSEDTTAYAAIQISVFSSHASATNGLSLQQSSDGSNWDVVDTYTVSATTAIVIQLPTQAKFFRLVYTNGATLTTSLRIQTIFKAQTPRGSSQRPADATSNENDFEQTLAFGMLYNGTTWDRQRGDITNGLDVDVTRVPTDPFGANADAASATGSISAKLRFIAATGIPITGNPAMNVAQINAVTPLMGNGVTGTGSQRVTIASDNTAFSVNSTLKPATTGGLSKFHLVSAATTNATNVKASAGQLYGWYIYNSNAAARKVAFHNTAGTPTAGASITEAFVIPPGSAANVFSDVGIAFSSGIAITTVTDLTDAGTTAVGLNDLVINLYYS